MTAEWVKAHPYWQSKANKPEQDASGGGAGAEDRDVDRPATDDVNKPKRDKGENKKSARSIIVTKQWLGRANCIVAKLNQEQVRVRVCVCVRTRMRYAVSCGFDMCAGLMD